VDEDESYFCLISLAYTFTFLRLSNKMDSFDVAAKVGSNIGFGACN
jgi:hypothetical protein